MVLMRTVEVVVHEHPGGRKRLCRRRLQDARLWEQIEGNHLDYFLHLFLYVHRDQPE